MIMKLMINDFGMNKIKSRTLIIIAEMTIFHHVSALLTKRFVIIKIFL